MRSLPSLSLLAASAICGLLLGFAWSGRFANDAQLKPVHDAATSQPLTAAKTGSRRSIVPAAFGVELETKLHDARADAGNAKTIRELQQLVDRWLLAEPLECIAWLQAREALGLVRWDLLRDVFASYFRGDLAVAIQAGREISDHQLRHAWLAAAFEEAIEVSPSRAFELLSELPERWRQDVDRTLAATWGRKNGREAWHALMAVPPMQLQQETWAGDLMQGWAEADPHGLTAFIVEGLDRGSGKRGESIFRYALQILATTEHPEVALAALAGRERDPDLENTWRAAVGYAGHNEDLGEVLRLVEREPAGLRRDYAVTAIAKTMTAHDDSTRPCQLVENVPGFRAREVVDRAALEQWSQSTEPEKGAALVESQTDPLLRVSGMECVVGDWLRLNPRSFVEYALVANEPDGSASWMDTLARLAAEPSGSLGKPLDDDLRARVEPELAKRLAPDSLKRAMGKLFATP